MNMQEIMDQLRGRSITAIRLTEYKNTFELQMSDGAILTVKTGCEHDNHCLEVSINTPQTEVWIK